MVNLLLTSFESGKFEVQHRFGCCVAAEIENDQDSKTSSRCVGLDGYLDRRWRWLNSPII